MQLQYNAGIIFSVVLVTFLAQSNSSVIDPIIRIITPKKFVLAIENVYRNFEKDATISEPWAVKARQNIFQTRIPENVPFPCDVRNGRSPERPSSVHALRPGDIDVVGAMGDSLTAGFGAKAILQSHIFLANRGVAFSAGSEETWRTVLTLPNILKEFNPNLVGYSTGDALSWQPPAELNVAEGFATVEDMPHQALLLIQRMKNNKKVDFNKDWKLITILIGFNDVCGNMCSMDLAQYYEHERSYLTAAIDILYEKMPRVLVNLVSLPNVISVLDQITQLAPICEYVFRPTECTCIVQNKSPFFANQKQEQSEMLDILADLAEDIANLERYKKRPDFAIVAQTFIKDVVFPTRFSSKLGRNLTDYSYLSPDCFHFSQKGHALAANALWNNMLEPVGQKLRDWTPQLKSLARFLCPSEQQPYFYTAFNSPSL